MGTLHQKHVGDRLLTDPVPSSLGLLQPPERADKDRCPNGHPQAAHSCSCSLVCPAALWTLRSGGLSQPGQAGLKTFTPGPRGGRLGGEGRNPSQPSWGLSPGYSPTRTPGEVGLVVPQQCHIVKPLNRIPHCPAPRPRTHTCIQPAPLALSPRFLTHSAQLPGPGFATNPGGHAGVVICPLPQHCVARSATDSDASNPEATCVSDHHARFTAAEAERRGEGSPLGGSRAPALLPGCWSARSGPQPRSGPHSPPAPAPPAPHQETGSVTPRA